VSRARTGPPSRRRRVALVFGLLVILFTLFAFGVSVALDGRHPGLAADYDHFRSSDSAFEPTLSLYTRTRIVPGNVVSLLQNGDATFGAIWSGLRAAQRSIMVQQYFALPGAVTDTLARILSERARAGVTVRLLFDGHGASGMPERWYDSLRAAGVQALPLRPLTWQTLYRVGNRSHVRMVVIDDSIAFTGGFGFADDWLGNGAQPGEWRETNVRVTGPAAAQLRALFAATWFETTGELMPGADVSAAAGAHPDGVRAGVFHTAASPGHTPAEPFLALSIGSAEKRLYIASSYFVPDRGLRAQLIAAAQRGVDVRVLTAGRSTDVRVARYAGRYTYGELIAGGVRIFEYDPTMMHAKTFVIDGRWSSVGSMNLDGRSISFNDEANLVVFDAGFAAQMEAAFLDDLRRSTELTPALYAGRRWHERLLEWFATLGARML
jgi:cardiolipin synthase